MVKLVDDSNSHICQAFLTMASGVSANTVSITQRERSEHRGKKGGGVPHP
jgi:hypothetical protein